STPVGKQLASMAGLHMKRITMELGGHAPVIVFEDADVKSAATVLAGGKDRNAGQVRIAPTRFLVRRKGYDEFVVVFRARTHAVKLSKGFDEGITIGPLANDRRQAALTDLVEDARR